LGGNTFTVTIASPAVFSLTAHGLVENDTVVFTTTGALPTGLTVGTTYYVIAAGLTADTFEVSTSQGGSAVNTSGTQSGVHKVLCTTNASGNGMVVWKDYLVVARDAKIDTYGPLSGSPTWKFNWQSIDTDSDWHPMIPSKNDDKVYGGAGKYVFSIAENSGQTFAPGTSATYTFTAQALDLPASYKIKCLEELGNNLMSGTWQGTTINAIRVADIFPWDRSSASFGQPISLNEYGVHALLNNGNSLIVLAGIDGTIFKSNGATAWPIAQLPQDLSGGKYIEYYPGSIVNYKKKVFFGTGWVAGATAVPGMGIYSLNQTSRGNILNLEHLVSTLNDGTTNALQVSALLPITSNTLLAGWRDDTSYGIDLSSATSFAYGTDYSGYFDSPLYEIGNEKVKAKPMNLEIHLGRPLRTDEGIKVSYRNSLANSFTAVKTMAYADNGIGAITSKIITTETPTLIKEGEQLQLRVAFKGTTTTSPDFKFLILQ
jgi:hypothetical protein